jgi:ferredoxin
VRKALDPNELVNRGVLTRMRLHGSLGRFLGATFVPGIGLLRRVYGSPLTSWLARTGKAMMGAIPGPSAGRGEPAAVGARFRVAPLLETQRTETATNGKAAGSILLAIPPALGGKATAPPSLLRHAASPGEQDAPLHRTRATQTPEDRAIHCVNCGECNVVCPIYSESKIRLPQMLTHLGEAMRGGEGIPETGSTLLDLCMRCGNCEEVCQAGIPHLPLYERMQKASDAVRPKNHERHAAIVATVRSSPRYRDDFLKLRGGIYLRRSPASLPGVPRFVVMRSENDAGPASTCIHCGACVPVCPTNANREFEGADPRWITTVQDRCIGCGSCVEVCPANLSNGGRTLRVMEAPTPTWFVALEEFNSRAGPAGARTGVGDRP